jgi:predicted Zn-dependent protease
VAWTGTPDREEYRVAELALATHHPVDTLVELTPDQVELVASHEMGHALGLPHSDDPRDIMFPENTALRLSTEDFRTLQALYALPNGAVIR